MPAHLPNHFNPVPYKQGLAPSTPLIPNAIITTSSISAQTIGKLAMPQNKTEHLNSINHHLKALKADGFKSRQAIELLLNQNDRNQLALIHRLEAAVFDALHDGVSDDEIAAIDPTVENILRDVEESLVH